MKRRGRDGEEEGKRKEDGEEDGRGGEGKGMGKRLLEEVTRIQSSEWDVK